MRWNNPQGIRAAQLKWSFVAAGFWMIVAHAYRWFGISAASHDGLVISGAAEALHQVSLGRFLEPVYAFLRGNTAAPFLVGLLSFFFIACSVFLVARLLKAETPLALFAIAGTLATSITVTLLNAAYTNWFDVDMLALLLSVLAVYLCTRRRGFIWGGLALAASLGLYQSYLQFFLSVAVVAILMETLRKGDPGRLLKLAGKLLAALAIGALAYVASMGIALQLTGAIPTEGYNGLASVGDYSGLSPIALAAKAYLLPLVYGLCPETHFPILVGIIDAALAVFSIAGIARILKRTRAGRPYIALSATCVLALPLCSSIVYIVSRGVMHGLMIHAFSVFYLMALGVFLVLRDTGPQRATRVQPLGIVCTLLIVVFACNSIYANDLYVRKDLEAQATLSALTRIIDRIEQTPSYIPGETEVVLIGNLNESPLAQARPGISDAPAPKVWESLTGGLYSTGFFGDYSVTYLDTYRYYFTYLLGYPINLAGEKRSTIVEGNTAANGLKAFPDEHCTAWADGSLVVKLS